MKYLKRCEERNTSLSEDEMWEMVESFEWEKDHDYDRIQKLIDVYPKEVYIQLYDFVSGKESELYDKYKEDWLGDPGIEASDDSWGDLLSEVVGRGKDFYNNITVSKLQNMAIDGDYQEKFSYSFQGKYFD